MATIVRGSEYQSFLNCRKQWFYQWVEGIEAKKPDGKLFFGNLFHKWLEEYYQNGCDKLMADMKTSIWFNEQDTADMVQEDIDDMMKLFKGVSEHYHKTYGESDKAWKVIATEMEFIVKLDEELYMTGTIDLVYETPEGKIRFADHKTVSSIQMYVDKAVMDRQISRYWWALKMIAAGVGRVKKKATREGEKDMWVECQELLGKEIDGFDYNLIAKDYPKEPKVLKLKKGQSIPSISQDKAQKTTYDLYLAKIKELGANEAEYDEFLSFLKDKPNQWLNRVDVLRTDSELEASAWEFSYTAGDIHDVKLMIENNPQATEPLTYRNITKDCMHMCQYKSLCQTVIQGGNVSLTKNLGYKKREEKQ